MGILVVENFPCLLAECTKYEMGRSGCGRRCLGVFGEMTGVVTYEGLVGGHG